MTYILRQLFLTVLEVENSEITVPALSGSDERPPPRFEVMFSYIGKELPTSLDFCFLNKGSNLISEVRALML